ncbi:putative amino acid transporter, transmembrane domain-containing protein [Lupinus albus]|uniref:Putative amino acid transporter, transmembrane domain-containing protein n=1 Tax=Lupinus albus TaxID=3870 RepID=A0A6A4R072_LUPAL|nr:putative amino acid transporter, transmembrane domain-containing protein [Lupinus albus]
MCINIMFGKEVESQITLNLPINRISSQIAIYTTLVNPISKYALMVTPITNALKALLPQQYKKDKLTSILINTILVISTVIIAITVPFFAYLTSLVGAFLSITASIILMCSCYLKISGTYNKLGIETVAIMTIIFLGVVVGIFGTYTSLLEIINHL